MGLSENGGTPDVDGNGGIAGGTPRMESNGPYSEDGVDLTLIRWMLSLTPTERLDVLQDTVRSIARLKGEETED